jgi:hypothetical protein
MDKSEPRFEIKILFIKDLRSKAIHAELQTDGHRRCGIFTNIDAGMG